MRTTLLIALLAATAAIPAAVSAQEYHHGHDQGDQEHGQRQYRGQGAAEAPSPAQQNPQPQPEQQGGRGEWVGRQGGRGQPQVQPQPQAQPQQQRQPQFNRGPARDGFRDGGGYGGQDRGGVRQTQDNGAEVRQSGQQPQAFEQDRRGSRAGYRDGGRQDYRGAYEHNGNDWRAQGRAQQAFGERRDWNRDWRQDRRYDWNGYRARNRNAYHLPRYYAPYGWNAGYRRFSVGFRLSSILFEQNYWIDDGTYYGLPPAYGPYRWVRYYNDALLVDIYSGQVVDTVYDIFW